MTLFKYVAPERLDVLKNRRIRFTQPGALNDPFELRPRFETLIAEAETLAHLQDNPVDLGPMIQEAYSMLPETHRALLPLETAAETIGAFMEKSEVRELLSKELTSVLHLVNEQGSYLRDAVYEALNRSAGILSLSESPDNELMWSHYACNHGGLLVCFDDQHEFFNRKRSESDEFYYLRKVIYSDEPPPSSLASIEGDALLITKGSKWAYEREWRMLAPLKDATQSFLSEEETIYLFDFPPDAVSGIVLGAQATPSLISDVKQLLDQNPDLSHIQVSQAVLDMVDRTIKCSMYPANSR